MDNDLSGGKRYPSFQQLAPDVLGLEQIWDQLFNLMFNLIFIGIQVLPDVDKIILKLFRSLRHATWFGRQTCTKRPSDRFYLLQSSPLTLARQTEPPLVMERAHKTCRGMVPNELCWADAHKRRGYPGKAGRCSVGEKILSQLQCGWNEFCALQGKPWCQGRCSSHVVRGDTRFGRIPFFLYNVV